MLTLGHHPTQRVSPFSTWMLLIIPIGGKAFHSYYGLWFFNRNVNGSSFSDTADMVVVPVFQKMRNFPSLVRNCRTSTECPWTWLTKLRAETSGSSEVVFPIILIKVNFSDPCKLCSVFAFIFFAIPYHSCLYFLNTGSYAICEATNLFNWTFRFLRVGPLPYRSLPLSKGSLSLIYVNCHWEIHWFKFSFQLLCPTVVR